MYDIKVYPNGYVIHNETYGYNYLRLSFLDVADMLTDEDECEIVNRVAKVFKDYMEERMEKA